MSNKAKNWLSAILHFVLLGLGIYLAWRFDPPAALVKLAGGPGFWVRAVMAAVAYLAFVVFSMILGAVTGLELGLPGGAFIRRTGGRIQAETATSDTAQSVLQRLDTVLDRLHEADERLFEKFGTLSGQLEGALEKIVELERRTKAVEDQVSTAVAELQQPEAGAGTESAR